MAEESLEPLGGNSLPAYAKTIMVVETILVVFLSFWISEEYQRNIYLQAYVNGFLQSSDFTYLAIGSLSLFSLVVVVLFARLKRTQKELQTIITVEHVEPSKVTSSGYLDHRTEQHLIELIRKSGPAEQNTQNESATMPVLKRENGSRPASEKPSN